MLYCVERYEWDNKIVNNSSIDVSDSYTLDRYNFYGVPMTITSPP